MEKYKSDSWEGRATSDIEAPPEIEAEINRIENFKVSAIGSGNSELVKKNVETMKNSVNASCEIDGHRVMLSVIRPKDENEKLSLGQIFIDNIQITGDDYEKFVNRWQPAIDFLAKREVALTEQYFEDHQAAIAENESRDNDQKYQEETKPFRHLLD